MTKQEMLIVAANEAIKFLQETEAELSQRLDGPLSEIGKKAGRHAGALKELVRHLSQKP